MGKVGKYSGHINSKGTLNDSSTTFTNISELTNYTIPTSGKLGLYFFTTSKIAHVAKT